MRQKQCMIFDNLRDVDGRKVVIILDEPLSKERLYELKRIANNARAQGKQLAEKLSEAYRYTGELKDQLPAYFKNVRGYKHGSTRTRLPNTKRKAHTGVRSCYCRSSIRLRHNG